MIIFYLCIKVMPLDVVHEKLVRTLGAEALAYSTLTKSVQSANFVRKKDRPLVNPHSLSPALSTRPS
jgi:hypothetical protein